MYTPNSKLSKHYLHDERYVSRDYTSSYCKTFGKKHMPHVHLYMVHILVRSNARGFYKMVRNKDMRGSEQKNIVIICNYQWWPQFKLFSHVRTPQKSTHIAKSTPTKCNWTSSSPIVSSCLNVYSTTRCISNSFI